MVCLKRCLNGILSKRATKDLQKKYRDYLESNCNINHANDDENVTINAKILRDESDDHDIQQECNNQEKEVWI